MTLEQQVHSHETQLFQLGGRVVQLEQQLAATLQLSQRIINVLERLTNDGK